MSAATLASPTPARLAAHATGPKTPQGKANASRNAVTHGLHSQDVVLPHLGESQEAFDALRDGLARELSPRTAVERHYVAQIAQAMWRLRRLTRWETHLYDDPALTDEERIAKMARVLRHDAALRRHIDRALKALRDAPINCQNEPAPCTGMARHAPTSPASEGLTVGATLRGCPPHPPVAGGPREAGRWVPSPPPIRASLLRKAQKLKQQKKCQNEPV